MPFSHFHSIFIFEGNRNGWLVPLNSKMNEEAANGRKRHCNDYHCSLKTDICSAVLFQEKEIGKK